MYVARSHSDRTLPESGQLAGGMEYPAVTMAIRRLEARWSSDQSLAGEKNICSYCATFRPNCCRIEATANNAIDRAPARSYKVARSHDSF